MTKNKEKRNVRLFVLVSFLFSWPIFFCVDGWLEPMFIEQNNATAARLSVLFGHLVGMMGPALAAVYMWRVRHKEIPSWSWSRPRYYAILALAMLVFWTVPGLVGLLSGDTLQSPIETQMWIRIVAILALGWISGMGEEAGWCAYLLPRLSPQIGKTRAVMVSGVIRGLWHWPVLVGPVIAQIVAGDRTWAELVGAAVVIALQLVFSNVLFGAVFGWLWYRTESIPLVGWLHYWYDLARDITIMLLAGYGSSLWVTRLSSIFWLSLGLMLLDQVLRGEGLDWKQFFGRAKTQASDEAA